MVIWALFWSVLSGNIVRIESNLNQNYNFDWFFKIKCRVKINLMLYHSIALEELFTRKFGCYAYGVSRASGTMNYKGWRSCEATFRDAV